MLSSISRSLFVIGILFSGISLHGEAETTPAKTKLEYLTDIAETLLKTGIDYATNEKGMGAEIMKELNLAMGEQGFTQLEGACLKDLFGPPPKNQAEMNAKRKEIFNYVLASYKAFKDSQGNLILATPDEDVTDQELADFLLTLSPFEKEYLNNITDWKFYQLCSNQCAPLDAWEKQLNVLFATISSMFELSTGYNLLGFMPAPNSATSVPAPLPEPNAAVMPMP